MISRDTYLRYREMSRRYEAARKKYDPKRYQRGGGYTRQEVAIISAMAGTRDATNEEKSRIEDFEWRMFPPARYFAYYDRGMTKITGFMGNLLGRIVYKGSVTRAFGGKRQNVTVMGTNNVMYSGVCNLTGGTYCRLKRIKGRGPSMLPNAKKRRKPARKLPRGKSKAETTRTLDQILDYYARMSGTWKNPRVKNLGSSVRVTMTADDVARFKSRWPASGLPTRSMWFMFDKRNGDLVDISPGSERFDGPALVALSQDAQKFAGL